MRGITTRRLVATVVVCLVVLVSLVITVAHASPTESSTSSHLVDSSFDSCPKCPICSCRTTSLRQRLRYCQPLTSRFLFGNGQRVFELPFTSNTVVRRDAVHNLNELLAARVVGQPQVTSVLPALLRRKLTYPAEPLVLHFAGDNGVGKTLTARLISQALSLHCGEQDGNRALCESGDNLLTISGTGLDGLTKELARRHVVWRVVNHLEKYPHGIVLIDDLTAMDPDVVAALAPLFGRGQYFPEQLDPLLWSHLAPAVTASSAAEDADPTTTTTTTTTTKTTTASNSPATRMTAAAADSPSARPPPAKLRSLSNLLVIVTTDFGKQGRTVGKSPSEIDVMVRKEFTHLYGSLLPAYTRTFAYVPFTERTAEAVVRAAVANLPCAMLWSHGTRIEASLIDDDAVAILVARAKPTWQGTENGHALRRLVEDELIIQVLTYLDQHGVDRALRLHFVYDDARSAVTLRTSDGNKLYTADDL